MNALDKIMKAERKRRYKRLKKLFAARDIASKYIKPVIKVSDLHKYFPSDAHNYFFTGDLAKRIVDEHKGILGITISPPRPVSRRN